MLEIRFHGRGGQGAVLAANLLAIAAGDDGKYSQAFPFFGVERRGAPVTSFCRIDDKQIILHEQIYEPDIIVVLDPTLVEAGVNVLKGAKPGAKVIVNSQECLPFDSKNIETYYVNATKIAKEKLGYLFTTEPTLESLKTAVDGYNAKLTRGKIEVLPTQEQISALSSEAWKTPDGKITIRKEDGKLNVYGPGRPIVNTAMLGALLKAQEVVRFSGLEKAISEEMKKIAKGNILAARACYNETVRK